MHNITSKDRQHDHQPSLPLKQPRADKPVKLTPRELEVLGWIARGKTSWEIGVIIFCKECTVNFHCRNIMGKLNACTRGHALSKAKDLGLTP